MRGTSSWQNSWLSIRTWIFTAAARRVCHHVLKSLLEHGEQVELLTFDFDPVRYAQIMGEKLPEGIVVHSLGKRIDVKPPFTVYKRRSRIIKLTKKIKDLDYDFAFSTQTLTAFESALFNEKKWEHRLCSFPRNTSPLHEFGANKESLLLAVSAVA